jgi:hypothetical protein
MKSLIAAALCTIVCTIAAPSLADAPALAAATTRPALFNPQRHMRVSEVVPGMKGYGLSVFSGSKIERFDVQVVSVLKNFNPRYDAVLITCPGEYLRHTGPIAGMSGSPIFLYAADDPDGKGPARMVGAFAYGWELPKDCLAGVQPVEYMLDLPTEPHLPTTNPADASSGTTGPMIDPGRNTTATGLKAGSWSAASLIRGLIRGGGGGDPFDPGKAWAQIIEQPGDKFSLPEAARPQLRPLGTPLMAAGMSAASIRQFAPYFGDRGLTLLEAGGASAAAGATPPAIEPGGVLAVPLLTGDLDLSAIGTVTEVVGDRMWGFGHPFFNGGPIDLPLGSGTINTVVANYMSSFKLGAAATPVGSLLTDQTVGVAGRVGGSSAPMYPIDVNVIYDDGTPDTTFHFHSALHPTLTGPIAVLAVQTAITGIKGLPEFNSVSYDLTIEFAGGQTVRMENRDCNLGPNGVMSAMQIPLTLAMNNPFKRVWPDKISGTVHVSTVAHKASLEYITLPRLRFRPGDVVRGQATLQPFHGIQTVLPFETQLPHNLPDGEYKLEVDGGGDYLSALLGSEPFLFDAETVPDIFEVMRTVASVKHDSLYVRLVRHDDGVAVGRVAMAKLPSSRRQVMLEAGRSDTTSFVSSDVKAMPTEWVLDGSAQAGLTIDHEMPEPQ